MKRSLVCLLLLCCTAARAGSFGLDVDGQLDRIDAETLPAVQRAEADGLKDRHLVEKMGAGGSMFGAANWDLGVLAIVRQAQGGGGPGVAVVVRGQVGGTTWQPPTADDPKGLGATSLTTAAGARLVALTRYPVSFKAGDAVEVIGYRTTGVRGKIGVGATEAPIAAIAVLRAGSVTRLKLAYPIAERRAAK